MSRSMDTTKSAAAVPVSVMVFTLNEEIHLPSCLASLAWCDDVIIVDSYSSDATESICRSAGVRFAQNTFTGFGDQRNWALQHASPRHDWVLILDADERVTPELVSELRALIPSVGADIGAFRIRRRFHLWGRWLRHSSLYPTWVVRLVHRDRVRYINRGHAETQEVQGRIADLANDLIDENLKGLDDWFDRQNRYAAEDAAYELAAERSALPWRRGLFGGALERRALLKRLAARAPARPLLYFIYSYVLRCGFLDGRDGLQFCLMKALYQRMVQIRKYDLRRAAKSTGTHDA
jgi:glycosyltransferase involved in cell wall biosynthesis